MHRLLISLILLCSNITHASLPYHPVIFPRDEGAHYKNIPYSFNQLIEWWYFNGKMTTDEGKNLSYDIAFFNPAMKFSNGTVIARPSLHMQLSDLDNKKNYGIATDYKINTGAVSTEKLDIILDNDYFLQKSTINGKEIYILKAEGHQGNQTLKFNLMLEPKTLPFLINGNGLMSMPNETNSYYYSIPHFATTGSININDATYHINKQAGDSWMDHQWGDFHVQENGWEWFSIRLENGLIANIFLNVEYINNHRVIGGLANIILPSGEKHFISYDNFNITRENFWFDSKLSISYPMTFNIDFPSLGLKIKNVAAFPEQEMHGYWEGYCDVSAIYNQKSVKGFSYTEIVYAEPTVNIMTKH